MKIAVQHYSEKRPKADVMLVGLFEGEKRPPKILEEIDPAAYRLLNQAIQKKRFEGKDGQELPLFGTDLFGNAHDILFAGLGKKESFHAEKLRRLIGKFVGRAKPQKAKSLCLLADQLTGGKVKLNQAAEVIPEILLLADYKFGKYLQKKKDTPETLVNNAYVLYAKKTDGRMFRDALQRSEVISEAVNYTRDLANEPANVMTPAAFAKKARATAQKGKLKIQILEEAELRRLGMIGILAVCQGSKETPKLAVMEYGSAYRNKGTICLVGKGVCFDTGGISIKPSKAMEEMKYDMCGAAAVVGTLRALSHLRPKVHVVGITPLVENMPSGTAQRPGDIITYKNGKSVEVINTDAEGRLILADALIYACEKYKPKALIDFATLTGACVVALADQCAGVMGNDERLIQRLEQAGKAAGELCWPLPFYEAYADMIKGHHTDILNVGSGYGGGTITAGKFLEVFVDCKSWVHVDIAGVAWTTASKPYHFRGATGFGVRLTCELLRHWR